MMQTSYRPRPRSAGPHGPKKRILIVDDSDGTRSGLAWLLGGEYDVVLAADGVEGLEFASSEHIDLVITDVWMPRLDGVEMVRRMRELGPLRYTPIIFLTGQVSPVSVVAGISAGARHYLAKPIDPEVLEERVRRALAS